MGQTKISAAGGGWTCVICEENHIFERSFNMIYSHEVEMMCPVAQGANHGPAPIPEEAKWVKAKEIKDISGFTHGVG